MVDPETMRTRNQIAQVLIGMKNNVNKMTNQLETFYLSTLADHTHKNRGLFKTLKRIVGKYNKNLNDALNSVVQTVISTENSVSGDLENIKELFIKGLMEIESDEVIVGDNQEL